MLSDEVIEKISERLISRIEKGNEYVLRKIGNRIKQIRQLSSTSIHEINQILDYGGDIDKIVNELSKITNINANEIYDIFNEVAKKDYQFAKRFYDFKKIKYIPFKDNVLLQSQIDSLARITSETYMNISNTRLIGFNVADETGKTVFKDLRQTYIDTIDTAILNVSEGKETFDEVMSSTLKNLSESGLVTAEYESGATKRLDSAVRMNILDSLRNLHNEIQLQIGEEINADGVEITVHGNPAVDHADAQGKQFTFEEFEKLQTKGYAKDYKGNIIDIRRISKKGNVSFRPISMYNCYHYIYSVVLGVNEPQYSDEQLNEINEENNKGFYFEDNHYTNYEGTQLQRKIEAKIRNLKNTQILAKSSNNKQLIGETQEKITILTKKYKRLCQASGLPMYMERMRVSGYKRVSTK